MLFASLLLLAVAIGSVSGDPDMPNYFIDAYEGSTTYYAYPLDICMQTGIQDYEYVIYTCSDDDSSVIKQVFKNKQCTKSEKNETYTVDDILDNGIYDFNCGGFTNYVELFICITTTTGCDSCFIKSTTYSVVDVCHYGGNGTSTQMLYTECGEDEATVFTYIGATDCGSEEDLSPTNLTSYPTCSYFSQVNSEFGTLNVYSRMTACFVNNTGYIFTTTETPTTTTEEPTTTEDDGEGSEDGESGSSSSSDDSSTSMQSISFSFVPLCLMAWLFN